MGQSLGDFIGHILVEFPGAIDEDLPAEGIESTPDLFVVVHLHPAFDGFIDTVPNLFQTPNDAAGIQVDELEVQGDQKMWIRLVFFDTADQDRIGGEPFSDIQ
jgi:hypothetical protein